MSPETVHSFHLPRVLREAHDPLRTDVGRSEAPDKLKWVGIRHKEVPVPVQRGPLSDEV